MSDEFLTLGTCWGVIGNLADTPLFWDSRVSHVFPSASMLPTPFWGQYQHGDTHHLERIANWFGNELVRLTGADQGRMHLREPWGTDAVTLPATALGGLL